MESSTLKKELSPSFVKKQYGCSHIFQINFCENSLTFSKPNKLFMFSIHFFNSLLNDQPMARPVIAWGASWGSRSQFHATKKRIAEQGKASGDGAAWTPPSAFIRQPSSLRALECMRSLSTRCSARGSSQDHFLRRFRQRQSSYPS